MYGWGEGMDNHYTSILVMRNWNIDTKLVKGAYLAVGSHYACTVDSFFQNLKVFFFIICFFCFVFVKYEDRYISTTHYKSKIGQSKQEKSYKRTFTFWIQALTEMLVNSLFSQIKLN